MAAVVVVSGLPGTGKSTVSRELATATGAQLLIKDVIEAALRRRGVTRELGSSWVAHEVLTTLARSSLELDRVVVLDTVAGTEQVRRDWREICERAAVPFVVIVCRCRDLAIHRQRLVGRLRGIDGWPELTWEDVEATRRRWEPWTDDHLVLDAETSIAANVAEAVQYVNQHTSQRRGPRR